MMEMFKLFYFSTMVLLSSSFSTNFLQKLTHERHKRWDNNGQNGDMGNMFRGTAGVDYPNYMSIPTTNFRCDEQQYEGGLYADVETQCQLYHICHEGRKESFLCGAGTVFNQQILACDYWYSTECDTAPNFYYVNAQISSKGIMDQSSRYNHQNEKGYRYQENPDPQIEHGYKDQISNPPQSKQEYNNQGNYPSPQQSGHGYNHESNNPLSNAGEYRHQENPSLLVSDNRESTLTGGNGNPEDKTSCCCLKNQYKAPWTFPTNA